ncbi:MAG TPA: dihydroxyacetone kinase subunit DhaL [Mesorhizobium sp.]|jgi:dihydroxyacetone kinase-like protein|nr:dihydroxyacetone kinase subunit DhaL [Mesorhizobium sp.]
MDAVTAKQLIALFEAIATRVETEKDRLSELDGAIGDGDHGVSMSIGFSAVTDALSRLEDPDPAAVFNAAARSFLNAVGASAGPLYATAFMRAGAAAKGHAVLDRDGFARALLAMAQGVRERGKAEPGEKTMVDAWAPAAEAAQAALDRGEPLGAILTAAAAAAREGAEATKAMLATKGRASRLGERSIGHMDPGAASAALIVGTVADTIGR